MEAGSLAMCGHERGLRDSGSGSAIIASQPLPSRLPVDLRIWHAYGKLRSDLADFILIAQLHNNFWAKGSF